MDLKPCCDDSFYDEISTLMPSPDDYAFDDIEEILRSTDSHLVSPLDLPSFDSHNEHDFMMTNNQQNQGYLSSNFQENTNISFPILESDDTGFIFGASTPAHESLRTSSTCSMDDDNCNLEEFINLFKDENIKMELITDVDMPQRNTPSPTDSCSSSSGSSTSGVQSDASSEASKSQTYLPANILAQSEYKNSNFLNNDNSITLDQKVDSKNWFNSIDNLTLPADAHSNTPELSTTATPADSAPLPIALPLLPVQPITNSSSFIQPLSQVQPINLLPGSLLPVKTVPLNPVTSSSSAIKAPTVIKIEPKVVPKNNQPVVSLNTTKVSSESSLLNTTKIKPPTNTKPKTVFLSFNDYKALTEMNKKHDRPLTGQPPKIILKTANGKVITANKIVTTGSISHGTRNFTPKVVKTNNTILLKQQAVKGAGAVAFQPGSGTNSITPGNSHLNIYKGIVDEKVWKKQQRMIKNRESASLSRKKKKEYVVSLETRISNLEKENYILKGENSSLRSQLVALAQTCQCKNSNISDFVLNSLNANQKINAGHHVKIAPKPTGKSIKQRMLAANVKKNVALLFAMAFMVSMNMGNFQTYLNKNSIENSIESAPQVDETQGTSRRLLWVETENEFKQNVINKEAERGMDVPPLHFLHPVNRSKVITSEQNHNVTIKHMPLSSTPSKCVGGANFTENQRLHINLHKWIDGNDYLNLSLHYKSGSALDNGLRFGKLATNYLEKRTIKHTIQEAGQSLKRKLLAPGPFIDGKQRKVDGLQKLNTNVIKNVEESDNVMENEKKSLKVFKPKVDEEYLRLFKGIKRQDDTFYVLSFNMDHLLLPASAYNKSERPKMSLMLPTGDPSINGDIVLMQIDCEVINTTELEVKSYMIPEKLRPQKYGHGSFHTTPNPNDIANNETHKRPQQQKEKFTIHPEMPKQKSPLKTYYMMGPRSAAAATAMKTKPTLVKLGGHESIANIILNGKNSTYFGKAAETVEGEIKYN